MKSPFRSINAVVLSGTVLLQSLGCEFSDEPEPDLGDDLEARAAQADATGEELFREILFPNAEVAKRVPELGRLYEYGGMPSEEQAKAVLAVQDLLVAGIQELDPDFFEAFEADITSGDPRRVKAALADSSVLLGESLRGWTQQLDHLLSKEGHAEVGEAFAGDEKLREIAELSVVDYRVLSQMAELLKEQLGPLDNGIHVALDLDTIRAAHLANPVVLDVQNQIDFNVAKALVLQRQHALDHQFALDNQFALDKITQAVALQLDNQFALDNQFTFDKVNQAVALHINNQFALDNQLNLQHQLVKIANLPTRAVDLATWGDVGDVTVDVETAIYAVVVVAVAVVAVVVAVVGQPVDGAAYLNGKATQLFQDQLVANVARAYAR